MHVPSSVSFGSKTAEEMSLMQWRWVVYVGSCSEIHFHFYLPTIRKVVGSIFYEFIGFFFFNLHNPSERTRPWGILGL
jgi:hypothetical protein